MITQITNGALSADYTIVVLVGCVGALIISFGMMVSWAAIRTLKQVEIELKAISARQDEAEDDHNALREEFVVMKATMNPELLAAQIATKLQALM